MALVSLAVTLPALNANSQISDASASGTGLSTLDSPLSASRFPLSYGRLPMSFEPNQGQTDPQVAFLGRGRAHTLFLTPQEAVLALRRPRVNGSHRFASRRSAREMANIGPMQFSVLRMQLVGANLHGGITGLEPLEGRVNYFHGNDPAKWRTNIPTFAKVKYASVYPGVDLVYYGRQGELEYDFIVAPGGNPKSIRFAYDGVKSVAVEAGGDLVLHLQDGDVHWRKPSIYQDVGGTRRRVAGQYVLEPGGQVGFDVAAYDVNEPLIIDPVLAYSTYLGGSSDESVGGIAVDNGGNAYVTGETGSNDFPTKNAMNASFAAPADAFVTKLGPAGTNLIFSTYVGANNTDAGYAIAIDTSNNVYVAGYTDSSNFPTPNGYQTGPQGFGDAFVAKISSNGATMLYGSYIGGTNADIANGVAVDKTGRMYLTGETDSPNFPKKNGFATTFRGGSSDAFVAKFNSTGGSASLLYCTFLGGSDSDIGQGIAVDISSNAYVTGWTYSTNFPATTGAIQTNLQANFVDAFVTRVNPTLTGTNSLVYSTYLGGYDAENFFGSGSIAVDTSSNAYVTGSTSSTNFPVTAGAFQTSPAGGIGDTDIFLTKIGPRGTNILYSTFFGGTLDDAGRGIAVLNSSNVYLTGSTSSDDFPTRPGAFQRSFGGGSMDAFVIKLNPTAGATTILYSTYLGLTNDDTGVGIAVDTNGNAYVCGEVSTNGFPITPGAAQPSGAGLSEGFIAKLSPSTDVSLTMSDAPDPVLLGSNVTYTLVVTNFGELAATSVTVTDALPAALTFVSVSTSVGTCTQIAGTVSCNLGTLGNGAAATITIVGTATAPGVVTNTATIKASQPDAVLSNNTATVTTAFGALASIIATIPDASETGPTVGRFKVTYTGTTSNQLTVNYVVSGTASNGVDYATLPGSVTIPGGLTFATITVSPLDDLLPECPETVIATLVSGPGYTVGAPASATVTIADNELQTVNVTASDANAAEAGLDPGSFTISRTACTNSPSLTVNYKMSGAASNGVDYTLLPGSVTFAAGATNAVVVLTPLQDTTVECPEAAVLTILTNANYMVTSASNATVTIADNDAVITITNTDASASEPGSDTGLFTVLRTGCTTNPVTVNFSVSGTATAGADYIALTNNVTIPANASSAAVLVTPTDDALTECPETVILTLSTSIDYSLGSPSVATVTITDNDLSVVTVVATDSQASEAGTDKGTFTVTRTGCTTSALTMNCVFSGTASNGVDYTLITNTVTIPAGSLSNAVTVSPIADALLEGDETVTMTLVSGAGYLVGTPSAGTVVILDNSGPRISVVANPAVVSEIATNNGAFVFSRDSFNTVNLTVNYSVGGTATPGVDYEDNLTGSVIIPAGTNSASVLVTPIDQMIVGGGTQTVVATILSDPGYVVSSPSNATVNILLDDTPPSLTVTSATYNVVIGNTNGVIDPGETVQETIVLRNSGALTATGVIGTISTVTPGITITQPGSSYPDIPHGDISTNDTQFEYRLAKSVSCGSDITFTHVAATGDLAFTNTFTRSVGQRITTLNTNTFASTNVPKSIPNSLTVYSTNTVSLAGTNIIRDVNVSLRMNETRDGDIVIAIRHPDNTEVILSNLRGGTGQNFGSGICSSGEIRTVFDDEATTAISAGTAPFTGSFRPDGVLSNFDGKTLNGNWRLRVTDALSTASSGTLTCWSLHIISSQQVASCSVFNNPPVANDGTGCVRTNTATNLLLTGGDIIDGDPITFRTNNLPAHGTLSNFSTLTGAITYTPMSGFVGADSFTFFTVDSGMATSLLAVVSITVRPDDADCDGMPDSWELTYGLNPNDPTDANKDPDGDGLTNLQEYVAGTDPQNAASALRITSIEISDSSCLINFTTVSGKFYLLERIDEIVNPVWSTITNNVAGTGGIVQVTDPTGGNQAQSVYRVRLLP